MLIVLSCGALFTYLGAIPADAHNAWPWGLSVLLYKIRVCRFCYIRYNMMPCRGLQVRSGTPEGSQLMLVMIGLGQICRSGPSSCS